ncbi:hypothetical protein BB561_002655 [Smittium simulii]|uniref:Uncharacterized protein n=1 Tax=Smittium simulii TaxID=133385 RepID=A0A2T9YPL9_9FUNG|nr:hypothetical protein BB561_002655 [Smittium simulii]
MSNQINSTKARLVWKYKIEEMSNIWPIAACALLHNTLEIKRFGKRIALNAFTAAQPVNAVKIDDLIDRCMPRCKEILCSSISYETRDFDRPLTDLV